MPEDWGPSYPGEPALMRMRTVIAILALTFLCTSLAGVMAQGGGEEAAPANPPPGSDPSPTADGKSAARPEEKKEKKELKVVRWVCTDHLCGGCDGQCSRHGHVATSRDGHCACTPRSDGELDQAIRKAFAGHEKGR